MCCIGLTSLCLSPVYVISVALQIKADCITGLSIVLSPGAKGGPSVGVFSTYSARPQYECVFCKKAYRRSLTTVEETLPLPTMPGAAVVPSGLGSFDLCNDSRSSRKLTRDFTSFVLRSTFILWRYYSGCAWSRLSSRSRGKYWATISALQVSANALAACRS